MSDNNMIVQVSGTPLTIWGGELKNIIYVIDDKITRAMRTALDNQAGFEVNAKISFAPVRINGQLSFEVNYKTNYKFDPMEFVVKERLNDLLQIGIDQYGQIVIPDDAEMQMMMDD